MLREKTILHDWRTKAKQIARNEEERISQTKEKFKHDWRSKKQQYMCSVCGKESEAEAIQMFDHGCDLYEHSSVNRYAINPPGGFSQCRLCNSWTCNTCQEQGICKNCAESVFGLFV
jgi:hypothetical protein